MSSNTLSVPALTDAHVHLRQDEMTKRIAPYTGAVCDNVICMPNTNKPPIHDPWVIEAYQQKYQEAVGPECKVHMVAKWLPRTTPKDVIAAKQAGAIGFKLYPHGATTNSDDAKDGGIPFPDLLEATPQVLDVLGELERQDMVLLCHGEDPGSFCMDREEAFLWAFRKMAFAHPKLRMTLEHITTRKGLECIRTLRKVSCKVMGTITVHHMMRTLDSVIGKKLEPDEFCMPIPKRPEDRDALLSAALSGGENGAFALGSDSAPHEPGTKYCAGGCAGVFSAPVMLQTLMELFGESFQDLLGYVRFNRFCVDNANDFYGFKRSGREVALVKRTNVVKAQYGGIVPFRRGELLEWELAD